MKNKKGFTLVELLIVIVVIGILAAMMMFSSKEAINSSKVTKLINDLQMAKNAALAYYADNYSEFRITHNKQIEKDKVIKYIRSNIPDWDK
ncbi:MAG: type II secretion system protein, partial [Synergistaceae bacterium]|nr:type II secretion system protein [Synergistaceae bacterium]